MENAFLKELHLKLKPVQKRTRHGIGQILLETDAFDKLNRMAKINNISRTQLVKEMIHFCLQSKGLDS